MFIGARSRLTSTSRFLRSHLHFIIIVPLLLIATTWPVFPNMLDSDTFWLPSRDKDVFLKFWDAWYGRSLLRGQAEFYYTDLHFHPGGLSLDYHNFSPPHMAVFGGLNSLMNADDAYGLTHLLIVLANTLSAYGVFLAWFRNRWVALSGAIAFGMHPYIIGHPQHPEAIFVAGIPLALFALHRGIRRRRAIWLLFSGLLLGFTAHTGMYAFVCLLVLFCFSAISLAATNWRNPRFWRNMTLVLALAAAVSLIRIYPMIDNRQALDEALDKERAGHRSEDALEYVANLRHPHTGPMLSSIFDGLQLHNHSGHSTLGLVFFAVAAYALIACRRRRQLYPWIVAILFFAIMRLGAVLEINGQIYKDILLPEYYLTKWFPWLFRAFWDVEHYTIGLLFPSAVLFACGLQQISARVPTRWRALAILAVMLLLSYERAIAPLEGLAIPQSRLSFIDWLAQEPHQDEIHIINLPMGRLESKVYGFYQTFNGYPQAEGLASRTPEATYHYINDNFLLRSWRRLQSVYCLPSSAGGFQSSLHQLRTDGFTHLILHHDLADLTAVAAPFTAVPAAYRDPFVSIYRLDDLQLACASTALLNPRPPRSLPDLLGIRLATPSQSAAILSIHSFDLASGELLDYYSALGPASAAVIPLRTEDLLDRGTAPADIRGFNPTAALTANQIVMLAHDPRRAAPSVIAEYRAWVTRDFKSCDPLVNSAELHLELFLVPDFPCELVENDEFDDVQYDNGFQLGNLILQQDGNALDLWLKWNRLTIDRHSISVQFFNSDGAKVYNQDFVVKHQSLNQHRVDLSGLAPGEYQVKLVLYDFETGASAPGEVVGSENRFERELTLARLTVE